jgi:hypothetical protein
MRFSALATGLADGGEVDDRGDELLYCDPHPFAFFSGAIRSHSRPDGAGLIERADAWFAAREHEYIVLVRDGGEDASLEAAAEAAGLVKVLDRYPAMGADRRLEAPPSPGLDVRPVADEADALTFWRVCALAYPSIGFPEDAFDRFPTATLLHDASTAFIGEVEGEPVATAMTTVLDGVGLVGWVAAIEAARGCGAGATITVAATNAAFDRGARLASLQASPMGESLYLRLGYRELFNYRLWARARP